MNGMLLAQEISNPLTTFTGHPSDSVVQLLISNSITAGLIIGSVIFIVIIFLGGISWITSNGDKGAVEAARARITHALIGITVLFSVFAIATIVGNAFGIKMLQVTRIPTPTPIGTIAPGGGTPTPTPVTTAVVYPNSASGQTCSQICIANGRPNCLSVGNNAAANNGAYRAWYPDGGGICTDEGADCSVPMSNSSQTCEGRVVHWTNCRCQ